MNKGTHVTAHSIGLYYRLTTIITIICHITQGFLVARMCKYHKLGIFTKSLEWTKYYKPVLKRNKLLVKISYHFMALNHPAGKDHEAVLFYHQQWVIIDKRFSLICHTAGNVRFFIGVYSGHTQTEHLLDGSQPSRRTCTLAFCVFTKRPACWHAWQATPAK